MRDIDEENFAALRRDLESCGDERRADVLRKLAKISAIGGYDEEAIKYYTQLIIANPDDDFAYAKRSLAYQQVHRDDAAIADLTKAIDISPLTPHYYSCRARLLEADGQSELAISDFYRELALRPHCFSTLGEIGRVYLYGFNDTVRALPLLTLGQIGATKWFDFDLGLSYYIDRNFKQSLESFSRCNDWSRVPAVFQYLCALFLGRQPHLSGPPPVSKNIDDHARLLQIFTGNGRLGDLWKSIKKASSTYMRRERLNEAFFFLGQYFLSKNQPDKSEPYLKMVSRYEGTGNMNSIFKLIATRNLDAIRHAKT